jgi:hypothetical protein
VKEKHVTLSIIDKMNILDKLDADVSMTRITENVGTGKHTASNVR